MRNRKFIQQNQYNEHPVIVDDTHACDEAVLSALENTLNQSAKKADFPRMLLLEIQLYGERSSEINHRAFLDKDSGAEKGLVAWMRGNYPDWLVQCDLPEGYDITKKWKARLRVRIEAKAKDGVGLNFGVYDQQDKKGLYSKKIEISEFDGNNYTVIETPYFNLGHKMYLWFSPPDRPLDEVEKVFIDRVILIREE